MPSPVVNLIIRSALDRDALAFCTASGATDKMYINAFVRGVKSLGLWNSLICWPCISTQNAGTGSTLYSLGGGGTNNMTLTNGPTWGTTGIAFVAASSQKAKSTIETSVYAAGFGYMAAFYAPSSTQAYSHFFGEEGSGTADRNGGIRRANNTNNIEMALGFTGGAINPSKAITFSQWNVVAARMTPPSGYLGVNGSEASATTTGTFNPNTTDHPDTVGFAARYTLSPDYADMTAAFGAFFTAAISQADMESFRLLYKSTLGASISLP